MNEDTNQANQVSQPNGMNPNPNTDGAPLETNSVTVHDTEGATRAAGGSTEIEPGVFHDPSTGMDRPQHYPAAVVIDDKFEDGHVKAPVVTPEEFNDKMNPADARTTDSELIVHATDFEQAQKLQDEGRSKMPAAAQDPEATGTPGNATANLES